jgi:hypothetical protein
MCAMLNAGCHLLDPEIHLGQIFGCTLCTVMIRVVLFLLLIEISQQRNREGDRVERD